MRKVGRMKGMPTKLSAVGILVGTLMAIGNGCWALEWGRETEGRSYSLQVHRARSHSAPQGWRKNPTALPVIMFLLRAIVVIIVVIDNSIYCYIIIH